jgi:GNAT superfamily N-acetyltransferase
MDAAYQIRRAGSDHLRFLPGIEREAAKRFVGRGLPESVLADPTSASAFQKAQQAGLLWVALSPENRPVGFALVELVDGLPHLEELDVDPAHGRRGVGSALVRAVCEWAARTGMTAVTLTTFREIPWNAPLYARLGFRPVETDTLTPALAERVREEAKRGLAADARVVMRFEAHSR